MSYRWEETGRNWFSTRCSPLPNKGTLSVWQCVGGWWVNSVVTGAQYDTKELAMGAAVERHEAKVCEQVEWALEKT